MSEVCREPQRNHKGWGPFFCSLEDGHDGKHKAKTATGEVIVEWSDE